MKILLLIPLLLLLFIGCKKQNSIKINPDLNETYNTMAKKNNAQIIKESDYLYFKDEAIFNSTINELENMNESEKNIWENKFNGFQSMNNKFMKNLIIDTLHFWRKQYV
jgi:hypothetical protein